MLVGALASAAGRKHIRDRPRDRCTAVSTPFAAWLFRTLRRRYGDYYIRRNCRPSESDSNRYRNNNNWLIFLVVANCPGASIFGNPLRMVAFIALLEHFGSASHSAYQSVKTERARPRLEDRGDISGGRY